MPAASHAGSVLERYGPCRWEMVECGAGAPQLSGATLPQGMTGPALLRQQMDAAVAHNLTVMRFWVPGVSPSYALQTSPGAYNEGMLKGTVRQQSSAAYLLNLRWYCKTSCSHSATEATVLICMEKLDRHRAMRAHTDVASRLNMIYTVMRTALLKLAFRIK